MLILILDFRCIATVQADVPQAIPAQPGKYKPNKIDVRSQS